MAVERNIRGEHSRRGFTVVELAAVIGITAIIAAVGIVSIAATRKERWQKQDSTQIRGVVQAMAIWTNSNADSYATASLVDRDNTTVPEIGRAKDHTANLMSLLINIGGVTPELVISPAETNPRIAPYMSYQYDNPAAAVDPSKAQWDPGFSADFTSPGGGNFSYAHTPPVQRRLAQWANTFATDEACMGNRGPEIAAVARDASGGVTGTTLKNGASNTLRIHGPAATWEGNIGYNDGHVGFEQSMAPKGLVYTVVGKAPMADVLFVDEADDPGHDNAYLGVWIKAGETLAEFQAIWD